eukprot:Clim_evm27s247 gene=Clim_evmTU27s247
MRYGHTLLQASENHPWQDKFLDYKGLKKLIKREKQSRADGNAEAAREANEAFFEKLDEELQKITNHFMEKQREILYSFNRSRKNFSRDVPDEQIAEMSEFSVRDLEFLYRAVKDYTAHYRGLAEEVLFLLDFVEYQVTGLRKILKKRDKNSEQSLTQWYILSRATDLSNLQLRDFAVVNEDPQVPDDLGTASEVRNDGRLSIRRRSSLLSTVQISDLVRAVRNEMIYLYVLRRDINVVLRERAPMRRMSSIRTRHTHISDLEPVLARLRSRHKSLQNESKFMNVYNEFALEPLNVRKSADEMPSTASYWINMMSTFLYLTNYYIVIPTSEDYAVSLNAPPLFSALIVGMAPVAALVGAILYSVWTQTSYRKCLMFSSLSLCVGNIVYSMARPFGSIWMVLAGRLLCGFGGARAVNRRFITDEVPLRARVKACSQFVTASALGVSVGPLVAAVLGYMPDFEVLGVSFDKATAPGWFMALMWLCYGLTTSILFNEPKHMIEKAERKALGLETSSSDEMETGAASEDFLDIEESDYYPSPSSSPNRKPVANGSNGNTSRGFDYDAGDHETDKTGRSKETGPVGCTTVLWNNFPMIVCVFNYFALKLALESYSTSVPLLTGYYYGWSTGTVGMFMCVLGLTVFISNGTLEFSIKYFKPKLLMVGFIVTTLLGCLVLALSDMIWPFFLVQYLIGAVLLFQSTQVWEGLNMSLLSQVIPPHMAQGIFNAGFLSTEAGTSGRAMGNVVVSVCLGLVGKKHLSVTLFSLLSVVMLIALVGTVAVLPRLGLLDDEEEDDDEDLEESFLDERSPLLSNTGEARA